MLNLKILKLFILSIFTITLFGCEQVLKSECSPTTPICYEVDQLTIAALDPTTHEVTFVDSYGSPLGTVKVYDNRFWGCWRGCKEVGDRIQLLVKYKYIDKDTKLIQGVKY